MSTTLEVIEEQIKSNNVLLYMKGTPQFPQCGFSARAVEVLNQVGESFGFVNILEHPDIRSELPKYAQWPTFSVSASSTVVSSFIIVLVGDSACIDLI